MNLNKIYKSLSLTNDLKAILKGRIWQRIFNKILYRNIGKWKK